MALYNQKYNYNLELFKNPSAITYYLLGVFITDGNIHQSLLNGNIYSKDGEWLQSLATTICPTLLITNRKDRGCYYFNICNKFIVSWLINHECVPNKSLTVKVPANIPKKYITHFLRGVIDGDGHVSCYQNTRDKQNNNKRYILNIGITTGSKKFAEAISSLISSLGVKNHIRTRKKVKSHHNHLYDVRCDGSHAVKLCQIIYRNKNLFLKRKYESFIEYEKQKSIYDDHKNQCKYGDPLQMIEMLKTQTYDEVGEAFGVAKQQIIYELKRLGLFKPRRLY